MVNLCSPNVKRLLNEVNWSLILKDALDISPALFDIEIISILKKSLAL